MHTAARHSAARIGVIHSQSSGKRSMEEKKASEYWDGTQKGERKK